VDVIERTATVDGTPIRWLEQDGDGIPVVLVHGIPTSPALWRHVVPRLSGLRVLAFEMTGYGDSIPAGKERDISVAAQAERLLGGWTTSGSGPRCWSDTTSAAVSCTSPQYAVPRSAPGCS